MPHFDALIPFPKLPISDSSKLKGFADANSKLDENGRKFSKRIENTVEKEKLLVMSNFSFSHSVFERLVLHTRKTQGLFGNGLRCIAVEKFVRKGEIACNKQFLLFSQFFLPYNAHMQFVSILTSLKFCCLIMG